MDIREIENSFSDVEYMNVLHPATGEPTGARILVASRDNQQAFNEELRIRSKMAQNIQFGRKKGITPEDSDKMDIQITVARIQGWEGLKDDGVDIPFSPKKAKELLQRLPWLREQINIFYGDRANFFKESMEN